ncbi:hypothetical protein C4546_05090 [Candidatus Parcubacteria bacterium]|jgi:hypothetical protein|nr:MAG: hypothetical protein C4546_05090 [Candidatus Parcubacteria bacterium]
MKKEQNHPQTRERIARLLIDKGFLEMLEKGRTKKNEELDKWICEIRKNFNLSKYYHRVLQTIISIPDIQYQKFLAGTACIIALPDECRKKNYFAIEVFPETSEKDVVRAFSAIRKKYHESDEIPKRLRTSPSFSKQQYALQRSEDGATYKKIAEELKQMGYSTTYFEVSDLIRKIKNKAKSVSG